MGKYFLQAPRDRNETEFLQLKQGKMSLIYYKMKFKQLSRYAVYLVDAKQKKGRRFELGLHSIIEGIMASHDFIMCNQVLQQAQAILN